MGSIFFLSNSVFVIVNNGFKLRKPPNGTREQPVVNLLYSRENNKISCYQIVIKHSNKNDEIQEEENTIYKLKEK